MFDLTSMKLVMLGLVALIVVGPKDLPVLLRTIGKYAGMIRRQATEFRAQFDEAMRESELAELRKEVEKVGREAETTFKDATQTVSHEMAGAHAELNASMHSTGQAHAAALAAEPVPALPPAAAAAAAADASSKAGV